MIPATHYDDSDVDGNKPSHAIDKLITNAHPSRKTRAKHSPQFGGAQRSETDDPVVDREGFSEEQQESEDGLRRATERERKKGASSRDAPARPLFPPPAWYLENLARDNHYGRISTGGVGHAKMEYQQVVGTPPFGWQRNKCMNCWSFPIFIINLIRLQENTCSDGSRGVTKVDFAQREEDVKVWPKTTAPLLYACSDKDHKFSYSDIEFQRDLVQKFLYASNIRHFRCPSRSSTGNTGATFEIRRSNVIR